MIEDHLDERLDRAVQHDDRLPHVDQLGRAFADAVAADQLPRRRSKTSFTMPSRSFMICPRTLSR